MTNEPDRVFFDRLNQLLSEKMGLYFTRERWPELERGIQSAADEFGFDSREECLRWMLDTSLDKQQVEILASHLTVGETYFFRESPAFQALEKHVFPRFIQSKVRPGRPLRIWSAGCCTGEEPYSLAMLLDRLIPGYDHHQVTILATDINPLFLNKARRGLYREWSFRNISPYYRKTYFKTHGQGLYELDSRIKARVKFSYLNLVDDSYPSIFTDTNAMDLIFCRNVLMYFTREQMNQVIRRFYPTLVEEGWLIVGASETANSFFREFQTVNFPGTILYRKKAQSKRFIRVGEGEDLPFPVEAWNVPEKPAVGPGGFGRARIHKEKKPADPGTANGNDKKPDTGKDDNAPIRDSSLILARRLYRKRKNKKAEAVLLSLLDRDKENTDAMILLSKTLANRGDLDNALDWVERAIQIDKLNPRFHLLMALILIERGENPNARRSLKRALYLDSDCILAQYFMGTLCRQLGDLAAADRHLRNTLKLLKPLRKDKVLPDSEGLTAGRLEKLIESMNGAPGGSGISNDRRMGMTG
jgi:chemotaxis protein methyltransferase CheR